MPSSSLRPPPGVCSPLYTNDCTSVEPALKLLQFADWSSYSEWRWVHVQTRPAQTLLWQSPTNSTQCGSLQIPRTHLFMGFEVVLTHTDWEKAKQRLYFQIRKFNLQPALSPSSLSCAHQPQSRTGPDCNQQRGSSVLILHQDTSRVVVPIRKTNLIKLILTVVHLKRQNVNIIHWTG